MSAALSVFKLSLQSVCHLQYASNTESKSLSKWQNCLSVNSCGKSFHIDSTAVFSSAMLVGFGIYTVSQKNWATFLRPITLEILNRSLPNWAQITFSSCWTSCYNLFESTLENSGAIWRIILTVNKKVIKVMNWQWLHHAVVSAMLLTITLLILSTEEKLWWW